MKKPIPVWLLIVIMIELIASAVLFTLVRDATRVEPACYFRQYSTDKIHYTVIKVKLSYQDSVTLKNGCLYFWRNNSNCFIDSVDLGGLPGGVCFK